MKKEDFMTSLLKLKESTAELFNDNRYENEISDVRRIINMLRDIIPKRQEIKDKHYKIEHKRNISEEEKERNYDYLRKLVRTLNDKEKYGSYDRNDHDCHGIADILILFGEIDDD